tara:strand:- start:5222 stop:5503 length:282 start_codon:yes stop_codon:yes gene_type:complete
MMVQLTGWASSGILLATLIAQVTKQWRSPSAEGVSWWLFVGQIAASGGFLVYSVLIGNHVFIVTNTLILLTSITGQVIFLIKRDNECSRDRTH